MCTYNFIKNEATTNRKKNINQTSPQKKIPLDSETFDLRAAYHQSRIEIILTNFSRTLIGATALKTRLSELATLSVMQVVRAHFAMLRPPIGLHMSFTGPTGTGKSYVARKLGKLLWGLGYLPKGHLVHVTRYELIGQFVGSTAPKTQQKLDASLGGIFFLDEAYYLVKPDNDRDYGREAVEMILQFMENNRGKFVAIFAGYADKMSLFYSMNPGLASRVLNHISFNDFNDVELKGLLNLKLNTAMYRMTKYAKKKALDLFRYERDREPLKWSNARAVDKLVSLSRLAHAMRLVKKRGVLTTTDLWTIEESDIRSK
jgi:probable Rubsico expression protein CbbX